MPDFHDIVPAPAKSFTTSLSIEILFFTKVKSFNDNVPNQSVIFSPCMKYDYKITSAIQVSRAFSVRASHDIPKSSFRKTRLPFVHCYNDSRRNVLLRIYIFYLLFSVETYYLLHLSVYFNPRTSAALQRY